MKTFAVLRIFLLYAVLTINFTTIGQAQKVQMSYANAFNMLNSGSKNISSKVSVMGSGLNSIYTASYNRKVDISYGIPMEIALEFAVVKARMSSDIASDPDTYNNSSQNVQQAFDHLAYGNFVKISDYNKVNVKLNFQFNPAKLIIYGSDTGDFLTNTQSSPWDVGVYKAPNSPVSGTKIMVIQK
jgi:hypothetical protein